MSKKRYTETDDFWDDDAEIDDFQNGIPDYGDIPDELLDEYWERASLSANPPEPESIGRMIHIYLRAWWPQWLCTALAMVLSLVVFWGVGWDLLVPVTLGAGFCGFWLAAFIGMAFTIFD